MVGDKAFELLGSLGFRPHREKALRNLGLDRIGELKTQWPFSNGRGTSVDLQWKAGWRNGLVPFPIDRILDRSEVIRMGGRSTPIHPIRAISKILRITIAYKDKNLQHAP